MIGRGMLRSFGSPYCQAITNYGNRTPNRRKSIIDDLTPKIKETSITKDPIRRIREEGEFFSMKSAILLGKKLPNNLIPNFGAKRKITLLTNIENSPRSISISNSRS